MNGWMERGRHGGEGTAGGRGRKEEMKVELSMEGLEEEERGRTSKTHYLRLDFLGLPFHLPPQLLPLRPPVLNDAMRYQ